VLDLVSWKYPQRIRRRDRLCLPTTGAFLSSSGKWWDPLHLFPTTRRSQKERQFMCGAQTRDQQKRRKYSPNQRSRGRSEEQGGDNPLGGGDLFGALVERDLKRAPAQRCFISKEEENRPCKTGEGGYSSMSTTGEKRES